MFRRDAAQTAKEREMVRNLERFLLARAAPASGPVFPPHVSSLGLSARRLRGAHKFPCTDTANLQILKDFSSPSRVYALYRVATRTVIEINHAEYMRSHVNPDEGSIYKTARDQKRPT